MAKYREVRDDTDVLTDIVRTTDNAIIPIDSLNKDYVEYLDWVAQGNNPDLDLTHTLDIYKTDSILLINQKAQFQIEYAGEWPRWRQVNAQSGIYGTITGGTKSVQQHCSDYIRSIIMQSNVYSDNIQASVDKLSVTNIIGNIVWDTTGIFSYTEVKNGA